VSSPLKRIHFETEEDALRWRIHMLKEALQQQGKGIRRLRRKVSYHRKKTMVAFDVGALGVCEAVLETLSQHPTLEQAEFVAIVREWCDERMKRKGQAVEP
jgi:hypothetical protein